MKHRRLLTILPLVVCSTLFLSDTNICHVAAQTVLVPSTFADVEGELSIANSTSVEYHSQQVYAASEFADLPPGELLLLRVDWRPDGDLMSTETYSAEQWIMKFSTTSMNPGELDATFANNVGADEVTVYSGPGSITTQNLGPAGGPKEIDYGIELQTPFPYDPSKGNLLWDLTILGGSQPLSLDWTLGVTNLTSMISTNGDPAHTPVASYVQESGGHIAQFTFASTPTSESLNGRFGNVRRVAGEGINLSGSLDVSPAVSRDGLEFIFRSDRNDPSDLFRVTRSSTDQPFGNLETLDSLNTEFNDNGANLDVAANELRLYFSSDRDDDFGNDDIFVATRSDRNEAFGNVVKLDEPINTEFHEGSPNISPDGLELFFASDRPGSMGDWDIYVARRNSLEEPFGEPENLGPNINSFEMEATPNLSSDGLHLIFASPRDFGELRIASRPSKESEFGPAIKLDDFGLGSNLHSASAGEYDPFLSADWPAPGSKIYFSRWTTATEADLWEATWSFNGDIDFDNLLTVDDINAIMRRIGQNRNLYDIDQDGEVTKKDVRIWVEELKQTYFGDANLDGEFNTSDLTLVFQAGQYEDGVDRNSTWEAGDWNADREFDTSDLVAAFQHGGFEKGPRAAVHAVPEPTAVVLIVSAMIGLAARRRIYANSV